MQFLSKKPFDNKPIRHKKGKGCLFWCHWILGQKKLNSGCSIYISITKVGVEYLGFAIRVVRILTWKIQVKLCVWIIYTIFELVHGMKWNILVLFEKNNVFSCVFSYMYFSSNAVISGNDRKQLWWLCEMYRGNTAQRFYILSNSKFGFQRIEIFLNKLAFW